MKNKIILNLLSIIFLCLYPTVTPGQTIPNKTHIQKYDDSDQLPVKLSYYKISDKVIVSLKITEYSKDIIYYVLSIKVLPDQHITQKGYAINPSSKLNGGVELIGTGKNGKEIIARPYYSTFCDCNKTPFNFYITTDRSKIKISSSRKIKSDLFNDTSVLAGGDPRETVDMFGFVYLQED